MKTTLTIILLLLGISGYSQSFYHHKMKKVKYPEIKNCTAMRPAVTIKTRLESKKLYRSKRLKIRQYARKNKL